MMKHTLLLTMTVGVASAFGAVTVPTVSNVTMTQSQPGSRLVTVTYDLDANAIVTCDFLTNGVSIGHGNISPALVGDVNKEITAGTGKKIYWRPYKSWADGQLLRGVDATVKVTAWAKDNPPDYMVVNLSLSQSIEYYPSADAIPGGVSDNVYKTSKMVFRKIPAANRSFVMGSPGSEVGRERGYTGYSNFYLGKEDAHVVSFTNDYYMAIYELTQAQYRIINGDSENGGSFSTEADSDIRPRGKIGRYHLTGIYDGPASAENRGVGYNSIVTKFRQKSGLNRATLPTEAEWEFAARAGESRAYYWGGEMTTNAAGAYVSSELGDYAWYAENSNGETHPVGLKKPNAWGLYDMYGNVAETTLDRTKVTSSKLQYPAGAIDPIMSKDISDEFGAAGNAANLVRGGSYLEPAVSCRSAARCAPYASWGFNDVPGDGLYLGARLAVRLF